MRLELRTTCIRKECGNRVEKPGDLQCLNCQNRGAAQPAPLGPFLPGKSCAPFPGRVVITLPWTALAADNLRKGVAGPANRERQHRYDEALARARAKVSEDYKCEPFAGPARVSCVFYMPDNHRRDHTNFTKALLDALNGILIVDDCWTVLRDVRLLVAGIDRDRPRAEITVEAIAE